MRKAARPCVAWLFSPPRSTPETAPFRGAVLLQQQREMPPQAASTGREVLKWLSASDSAAQKGRRSGDGPSSGRGALLGGTGVVLLVGDLIAPGRVVAFLIDLEHRQVGHEAV